MTNAVANWYESGSAHDAEGTVVLLHKATNSVHNFKQLYHAYNSCSSWRVEPNTYHSTTLHVLCQADPTGWWTITCINCSVYEYSTVPKAVLPSMIRAYNIFIIALDLQLICTHGCCSMYHSRHRISCMRSHPPTTGASEIAMRHNVHGQSHHLKLHWYICNQIVFFHTDVFLSLFPRNAQPWCCRDEYLYVELLKCVMCIQRCGNLQVSLPHTWLAFDVTATLHTMLLLVVAPWVATYDYAATMT